MPCLQVLLPSVKNKSSFDRYRFHVTYRPLLVGVTEDDKLCALSVFVENPCAARPKMVDGLPATTKSDRRFHGFGMRSIRSTVDKYGGTMDIDTDGGRFKLMIMIPVPA